MKRRDIPFYLLAAMLSAAPTISPANLWAHSAVPLPQHPHQRMIRGAVLSVDAKAHKLVIRLDGIPGYMSPMTMSYVVGAHENLKMLSPGDRIEANLAGEGHDSYIENINVIAHAGDSGDKDSPK